MLSTDWNRRKKQYDVVVIGSGYGGAITAARLSAPNNALPKKSVCILERGKEWPIGSFPDDPIKLTAAVRNPLMNPLGLYEFLPFSDISIIKGSGLGGTSLVNANVAIVPDEDLFEKSAWPKNIKLAALKPHYDAAKKMLGANPHPKAKELLKVKALDRRAQQLGLQSFGLDITVNFEVDGQNAQGVDQKPCIDCGDCVTGCNVGAKNTLYMNYLPMAQKHGTEIFTQAQVDWLQKLDTGGWRVFGRRFNALGIPEKFSLEAGNVILSAGALGTPEILLRSELKGLSLSPRVGTAFNGNGDFFGLAYNSDYQTNVLGFGSDANHDWRKQGHAPGPSIVGAIRYNLDQPLDQRITVEDLSIPKAYVGAAMVAFGAIGGEDMDAGDEASELARQLRNNPLAPYRHNNAMNHSMVYLVMGHDDAKGTIHLKTNFLDPLGRVEIDWDDVGRQAVFTQMNEEIRRHSRALGARFISNPVWSFVNLRNLVTAHPLGGCPMGDDHLQGAVDEFGRVYASDGSIHEGLFVADGSMIPAALGVNPFMTISAVSERVAERLVRKLGGEAYPERPAAVPVSRIDPVEVITYKEPDLERVFARTETLSLETIVNRGQHSCDVEKGIVRNDTTWKGFFPRGHMLNRFSTTFYVGFKKTFSKTASGYAGITSDSDERLQVRNTLEEIHLTQKTGSLEPGRYILLRYPDPPWNVYYDILKIVNEDLIIGRPYLGEFPNGVRLFTFAMSRAYGLDQMTVLDHRALYTGGAAPTKEQLNGLWEMHAVANATDTGTIAYLKFDLKPDGRLEARYRFMGLLEGLVEPVFAPGHFQLNDFTRFHDEIRVVGKDFMVGKYTTASPPVLQEIFGPQSLGLFHQETSSGGTPQFSLYYTLRRSQLTGMPATGFLAPLLDIRLPDGLGMTFDEEMEGYYFPGVSLPAGRTGDLQINGRIPTSGKPAGASEFSFQATMNVRDLNEFFENPEHEAELSGTVHFGDWRGKGEATFVVDPRKSTFNYLRVNPATGETEMGYQFYFADREKKEYLLLGRKYLQKDERGGIAGIREILEDYTTLYCHVREVATGKELGVGRLKFKTFETPEAVGSLLSFLLSFRVTGTGNPILKAQAQLRFLALTNQFVMREYDPLAVQGGMLSDEIREAVLRGAETPDYFSTRPTTELQTILRESPTLPLETLLNRGGVSVDYDKLRIHRDSFWKGSFAKDTLPGWEERIRTGGLGEIFRETAGRYTGGSFWKRFDGMVDGQARGYVVNYEVEALPGRPVVKTVQYPDNNRKYLKAGDEVQLLTYTNAPYRIVYDLIKVIDKDNCIGVMHLGEFPNGLEFATFVMARHNYPFEKMSVPDHNLIFNGERAQIPAPEELTGSWDGYLIFLSRPDASLLNQLDPVHFRLKFVPTAAGVECRFRLGRMQARMALGEDLEIIRSATASGSAATDTVRATTRRDTAVLFTRENSRHLRRPLLAEEFRLIGSSTLLGKWSIPNTAAWLKLPGLSESLKGFVQNLENRCSFHFVLKRS
jgi:cholesterol oxidase